MVDFNIGIATPITIDETISIQSLFEKRNIF